MSISTQGLGGSGILRGQFRLGADSSECLLGSSPYPEGTREPWKVREGKLEGARPICPRFQPQCPERAGTSLELPDCWLKEWIRVLWEEGHGLDHSRGNGEEWTAGRRGPPVLSDPRRGSVGHGCRRTPRGGILPGTLSLPRFPARPTRKSLGTRAWPGAIGHPGGHPPAQPPPACPDLPRRRVWHLLPASSLPSTVCFSSRTIASHRGSHPREVVFWRLPLPSAAPLGLTVLEGVVGWEGGWGPGGILGGGDVVSPWLLVLLMESGACVRAALASARPGKGLWKFLCLSWLLSPPPLPPWRNQPDLGQSPAVGSPWRPQAPEPGAGHCGDSCPPGGSFSSSRHLRSAYCAPSWPDPPCRALRWRRRGPLCHGLGKPSEGGQEGPTSRAGLGKTTHVACGGRGRAAASPGTGVCHRGQGRGQGRQRRLPGAAWTRGYTGLERRTGPHPCTGPPSLEPLPGAGAQALGLTSAPVSPGQTPGHEAWLQLSTEAGPLCGSGRAEGSFW